MKKKKSRLTINRKLVETLADLIEENPDMRFGQILTNWEFIIPGCDEYYTESEYTLTQVEEMVKYFKKHLSKK